jgi:hypothetical protein
MSVLERKKKPKRGLEEEMEKSKQILLCDELGLLPPFSGSFS